MTTRGSEPLPTFDHAVYAGRDLGQLVDAVEGLTGVRPVHGGEHEGLGTHNALLGLGDRRYLELLAPLRADEPGGFGGLLAALPRPRLFMWAVRVADLDRFVADGARAGQAMGSTAEMSRTPPSAPTQHWRLTTGGGDVYGGVIPFGIQWEPPAHPADDLAEGCTFGKLRAGHPEPERIRAVLEALEVSLPVEAAKAPSLTLTIETPTGPVALR